MLHDLLAHERQLHVSVGERDLELQSTSRRLKRIDLLGQPRPDLCRGLTLIFSRELDLQRERGSPLRGLDLEASQIGFNRIDGASQELLADLEFLPEHLDHRPRLAQTGACPRELGGIDETDETQGELLLGLLHARVRCCRPQFDQRQIGAHALADKIAT